MISTCNVVDLPWYPQDIQILFWKLILRSKASYKNMERAMSTLDQSKSWLSGFLPIEKPTIDIVVHPPKGVLRKIMHTPNAQSTHNENVVQEIPQAQCAASSMEILQYFSAQRKQLLSSTRVVDPSNATLITFDLDQSTDPFWNWFSDKSNMSWKEHFSNHNWWRGLDLCHVT